MNCDNKYLGSPNSQYEQYDIFNDLLNITKHELIKENEFNW
jgi:hypothetical protein